MSAHLRALDDVALHSLLRGGESVVGIGGSSVEIAVEDVPVFAKRVPLTALEQRPEHVRSTANLYGLPAYCQYGVGSPGFTAWRELTAQERVTDWALAESVTSFPLLYHWRVLHADRSVPGAEHGDPAAAAAWWHDAAGVARRLADIQSASSSLVLFLEHFPHELGRWLQQRLSVGGADAAEAVRMVDATLLEPFAWINQRDLFHFDSHLGNLLTDGTQVLVADFGLATAKDFELDAAEQRFLDTHGLHDVAYTATQLVNRLVTDLTGFSDPRVRNAYIADRAHGERPSPLPYGADAVVRRHAPVADVINAFYWRLHTEARNIPFPTEQLQKAARRADLPRQR